jgi:ActR/RegA family two-component response regulator
MNKNKQHLVFLVDDDEIYLDTLEHHLQNKIADNIKFKKYHTGEACLMDLYQNPTVIIIDHFLNTKIRDASTGLSTIKKIKTACPHANIVLLSSQKELDVVAKAISKYQCKYVVKNNHAFNKIEAIIKNSIINSN